jgi:hypothetical protein
VCGRPYSIRPAQLAFEAPTRPLDAVARFFFTIVNKHADFWQMTPQPPAGRHSLINGLDFLTRKMFGIILRIFVGRRNSRNCPQTGLGERFYWPLYRSAVARCSLIDLSSRAVTARAIRGSCQCADATIVNRDFQRRRLGGSALGRLAASAGVCCEQTGEVSLSVSLRVQEGHCHDNGADFMRASMNDASEPIGQPTESPADGGMAVREPACRAEGYQ